MKPKKTVLGDHVRKGKVLKPPITQVAEIGETSWLRSTMPELLWIGLIFDKLDLKSGVELCLSVSQKAAAQAASESSVSFALTSSFDTLTDAGKSQLVGDLNDSGELALLREALDPLVSLYPECPLSFLASEELPDPAEVMQAFKGFLAGLYNKRDRLPVLMQAQAVYTLGASGRLRIQEGSSLGNLDELRFYPHTEESKRVGAGICAACNMFVRFSLDDYDAGWAAYFWRRGFELDGCDYSLPYKL
ncbi:MAG: hypothetical protein AAFX41_02220 [Bacteroidota bacterium]